MFSEYIKELSWQEITERIYAKKETDVQRALNKTYCDIEDFMALISPAAIPYLELMAQLSRRYTEERFGKTISLFIPLYLTNSCANSCVYCSFHATNPMPRVILSFDQMEDEFRAIKALGPFESILLVTGENPSKAGVPYLLEAIRRAKGYFDDIKIEVMPLEQNEYETLIHQGLNGVVCFQETYHQERYNVYHPHGRKANYEWRINSFDRMGKSGMHSIGLGILIGLEDWRTDATMMAHHLRYLQKHYWRTRYSVNFPRLQPAENGGFQPNVIMRDKELAQIIFAMRIFDHQVDISFSTRESPILRDNMATLGVTTMSAGSKTEPGGYFTYPQSLEQFRISDERTPIEILNSLRNLGREPIWKDWDIAFDKPYL